MTLTGVISYPIPAYSNVPIEPEDYQPSRFAISAISLGQTTTVTTSVDHNYVIGQVVRLLIPSEYGSFQLNNVQGIVITVPAVNQVEILINSTQADAFILNPYTAVITGITQTTPAVITANNNFKSGQIVIIGNVSGMTELNGNSYTVISANSTTITINAPAAGFTLYSGGGTASIVNYPGTIPQILAIGDVNTGIINTHGRIMQTTHILGSFINISPN